MKYIKVNIQELLAALKPSQFRLFKEAILKKEYKKYLDHIFKGHDRLYVPFTPDFTKLKIPVEIENYVSKQNHKIVDYKAGLAENKEGRLAKIGKILNKDEEGKKLLDLFNTSRSGINKKDELLIVISRHPYDIAGMSTGRGRDEPGDSKEGWGWSSCMNLRSGINRHYVHKDIENGTLIAYVINSKDENINKPIARLLIKQYINVENKNDKILFPEEKVYGENVPGFREKVIEWLKTFQTFIGYYQLNPNLYPDGTLYTGEGDKKSNNYNIRKLYYTNYPNDPDAKKDKESFIRMTYYKNNSDDIDAKYDDNSEIRKYYYENHPNDKDAKYDESFIIRQIYYESHYKDKDVIYDPSYIVRENYYKNNLEDKNGKYDTSYVIRQHYYNNNPNDKDAKYDDVLAIRSNYFYNNPNDRDAKYDVAIGIVKQYYKSNNLKFPPDKYHEAMEHIMRDSVEKEKNEKFKISEKHFEEFEKIQLKISKKIEEMKEFRKERFAEIIVEDNED